ncbi:MAG TPA: HigA family addiction module antitoxin [Gammaproteobacteria bacterium]|jgi:addiction module HigA family antidote|nr:HigA family addiction module antitoxin [Gammaproteobacteria bacterium]HET8552320.1 HigA family addiction module antitoxin [Gammaproteobacteria bacterium]
MTMKKPPHPGEVLRDGWLEPLHMTVTEFARRVGLSRKSASELLNGRFGVSIETALRLEQATGTGAYVWLGMQTAYDLAQARMHKLDKSIKVEKLAA